MTTSARLVASQVLTGVVLWYGVQQLFMIRAGFGAVGIGICVAVLQATTTALDIPLGMAADRWGRKRLVLAGAALMAVCSVVMGAATSLPVYVAGTALYAVSLVATGGAWHALLYDTLLAQGREDAYGRLSGRAGAWSLAAMAAANIAGGVVAHTYGFRVAYWLSALPAVANMVLIWGVREPVHHGQAAPVTFAGVRQALRSVAAVSALRGMVAVMGLLWVSEAWKEGFGQVYFAQYAGGRVVAVGALWAVFYLVWAVGRSVAHRLAGHVEALTVAAVLPLVGMCFVNSLVGVVLFMVQAFIAGALFVLIDVEIQAVTPSAVRATVASARTSLGRGVTVPAMLVAGWVAQHAGILASLRVCAGVSVLSLVVLARRGTVVSWRRSVLGLMSRSA